MSDNPGITGFLTHSGNRYAVQTTSPDDLRGYVFNVFMNGVEFDAFVGSFTDDLATPLNPGTGGTSGTGGSANTGGTSSGGSGGVAADPCADERELCAGARVDPSQDTVHCGACGNACTAGQSCVSGACVCSTGLDACGSTCVDTS